MRTRERGITREEIEHVLPEPNEEPQEPINGRFIAYWRCLADGYTVVVFEEWASTKTAITTYQ
jgi:hypothetical protein